MGIEQYYIDRGLLNINIGAVYVDTTYWLTLRVKGTHPNSEGLRT